SWGVSTRLMGALIMTHSDDKGLVLPPKLAPYQVIVIPIYRNDEQKTAVTEKTQEILEKLRKVGISVRFDDRDTHKPGWKFNEYELKGVPIRIAIGPKDLENNTLEIARRDTLTKEVISTEEVIEYIQTTLEQMQTQLYERAYEYRESHTTEVDTYEEFKEVLETKGGFVMAHWDGTAETEAQIQEETKATIRCIPLEAKEEQGV